MTFSLSRGALAAWFAIACAGCADDDSRAGDGSTGAGPTSAGPTSAGPTSAGDDAPGSTGGSATTGSDAEGTATSPGDATAADTGTGSGPGSETGSGDDTGSSSGDASGSSGSTGDPPGNVQCDACGPDEVCVEYQAFVTTYECHPVPKACEGDVDCDCGASLCVEPYVGCFDPPEASTLYCACIAC